MFSALALKALEVYAIPTPWLHQDTTTIALYGAYEDEPKTPRAPRPAYGHSKDGRDDLKQVLLSLGVSGEGMAACPCEWAFVMAIAVIVWKRPWLLRNVSRWA